MASGSAADRTMNKVALCSAIFAGFAYVGYSVVRTAFQRRRKEGDCKLQVLFQDFINCLFMCAVLRALKGTLIYLSFFSKLPRGRGSVVF